ncbi:hypothetical protein [Gryllotalpicola protaetiae]|uniref:Uncharacterized protein n=1 Tax=Gryllotalpicola protaetiae TaxID=2419771 RepID=A0A387BFI7_9MICO|nr:hypothetical protein [Gryllotalpicola protaetiae]AYG02775.1 hypothetical protein D7I44_04070 [Gryllotalpicola protaetiae]
MSVSLFGALTADSVTPILDDGEGLRDAARQLYQHYSLLSDDASRAASTWSSLPQHLAADHLTPVLEPLMTPAVTHAAQLRDAAESFYRIASAAADEISDLKRRHDQLVADIESFHRSAPGKAETHFAQQLASGNILGAVGTALQSWQNVPALVADEAELRVRENRYEADRESTLDSFAAQINGIGAPRTAGLGEVGTAAEISKFTGGSWWDKAKEDAGLFGGLIYASTVGVTVEATKDALPYVEDGLSAAANATLSFGNAMLHHGDDDAALIGGALLTAGGAVVGAAGLPLDATGIGAVAGGGELNAAGIATMGAGAALVGGGASDLAGHAGTDDAEEPLPTDQVEESRQPNPNHPGRDKGGRYTSKDNDAARDDAAQKEQDGLDQYEDKYGEKPINTQVVAKQAGGDVGRKYDGLVKKPDGTWEGIEVKSGKSPYNGQQRDFDSKVSYESPATARLKGETIKITSVHVEYVK